MIEVKEALTRKQQREFIEFPNHLYKGNPYYVPPLYMDEVKVFRKDYVYYDTSEAVYYNAYKDGKMAGRINGILQRSSNEKWGQQRIRFTRFDVIDDFEVARALFDKVEEWGRSKGMKEICGPMGFSDLEREGMLIEGFDEMSTFEEQYNAPYYPEFMDRMGFRKDVDWTESQLRAPKDPEVLENMKKMSEFVLKRYRLHFGKCRTAKEFLSKYMDGFFEILDKSYEEIYGSVPFTDNMKKLLVANFNLIIDADHVSVILDENENVVCLGLCFPAIAKAMQVAGGHLTPRALFKVLRALKHPEVIDLALIGVDPAYRNRGISVCFAYELAKMLQQPGIKYADTNLNLEDNYDIQNIWKRFDERKNKRRRSYVKQI
ncbi:MAG: N-acetyltransferase [Bacteroidales bacterium]|nr:N-acetyltransferase [Bacteroidales bacterium]